MFQGGKNLLCTNKFVSLSINQILFVVILLRSFKRLVSIMNLQEGMYGRSK